MLKVRLLLAISALALSAGAPQRSAAQGPTEAAAPAAEQPAPAERAQRPTRRARRATQQTSFTGAQAGGFGGGNISGGGFVEPGASQCFRDLGPASNPITIGCAETPFNFDTRRITGTFGAFYGYIFQYGAMVYGFEVDVAYKNAHRGFSQPVGPVLNSSPAVCFGCFSTRTEYFNGSVTQGWDSSLRARFGYVVTPTTMVYLTAGVAIEQVSGTFTYNATTINDTTANDGGIFVDTTAGSGSWNQLKVRVTAGTGIEIFLGVLGSYLVGSNALNPVKARVEFRYTGFGNLTENIALLRTCTAVTIACPSPNFGSTNAQINLRDLNFQTIRVGLVVGL
jgi:outer membrane immunogenic protein